MSKTVTVFEREVSVPGWRGTGYMVIDPVTGDGAYMISGGGNGGFLLIAFGTILLWASFYFFAFTSLIYASSVALAAAAGILLMAAGAFLLAGNKEACFLSVVAAQRMLRGTLRRFGFAFNIIFSGIVDATYAAAVCGVSK